MITNDLKGKVKSNTFLTKDTFHLIIEVLDENFQFQSGQFLSINIPSEKTLSRAYSIGSQSRQSPVVEFFIKKVEGGPGSTYLSTLKDDDTVTFKGPYGRFTLSQNINKSKIFVSTGTGLSPNYAMIKEYLENGGKYGVRLIFGVRFLEDLFLIKELDELTQKYPNFSYVKTVSRCEEKAGIYSGRVTDYLSQNMGSKGNENTEAYICGNKDMILEAREIFQDKGLLKENIHFEQFF